MKARTMQLAALNDLLSLQPRVFQRRGNPQ